ncbi:MAG: hypothetical protein QMB76_04255 [Alphaproteobacteria bacterium]|jgi:hypothetical protein
MMLARVARQKGDLPQRLTIASIVGHGHAHDFGVETPHVIHVAGKKPEMPEPGTG